ncbi:Coronin-like protein crn1, partial [Ceratobasidium sp. 392]
IATTNVAQVGVRALGQALVRGGGAEGRDFITSTAEASVRFLEFPFCPLPHSLPHKLPDLIPLARGHNAPVLDTDLSSFDDSVLVSGGEDGHVLVWKVESSQFDG